MYHLLSIGNVTLTADNSNVQSLTSCIITHLYNPLTCTLTHLHTHSPVQTLTCTITHLYNH